MELGGIGPWLQTILQSYSNQNSTVLAQKEKCRAMELNRKSRDKSMHLRSTNPWQTRQEHTVEKRQPLQLVVLGKLYSRMYKNEIRTFSNTIHKSKLKMHQRCKSKASTIKILEENIGRTLTDVNCSNIFLDPPPRVIKIKTKINNWDLIKLKDFCTFVKETITKQKENPQNRRKCWQTK